MSEEKTLEDVIGFLINVAEFDLEKTKRVPIPGGAMTIISENYQYMSEVIDWIADKIKEPELNENQEIVLEWLKRECTDYSPKWGLINELHHTLGYSSTSSDELIAIGELSFKEELEVMNQFCTWALDQC